MNSTPTDPGTGRLASGLRVLVDEVPGAPVAAVYLWVDGGAAEERPGEHGAAHFVEHMLFKGSEARQVGDVATEIEALGGDVNAYTSHEQTVLHATVPAPFWGEALDVLADIALNPRFDADEVELEREVILDEIRGSEDDAGRALSDVVGKDLFRAHPYGRPVIGKPAEVRSLTRQALMGFWERTFRPSNMILAVAGPVSAAQVRERALELFPDRGPAGPRAPRAEEAPQVRRRSQVIQGRFDEPMVELSWRLPGLGHPDLSALDVLLGMLAGGPGSVLGEALQLQGLATDTWCALESEADHSFMVLGFSPMRDKLGEAITTASRLLSEVQQGMHLRSELALRARVQLLSSRMFTLETVDGRAHNLAWVAARLPSAEAELVERARVEEVGLLELKRVAAAWLSPSQCCAGALLPEGDFDARAFRAALDQGRRERQRPRPRAAIERRVLDNGLTVVVEPLEDSNICALRLAGRGGLLSEASGTNGATALWARTLGLRDRGPRELAAWLDVRGGSLGGVAGMNSLGLRGEFPAERLEDGLELFSSLLLRPSFPADEVRRSLAEMREAEELVPDHPGVLAWRAASRQLFGAHPYSLPETGTLASLARLGRASVERVHRQRIQADNLVLAVAGAVDPEAVFLRVERLFSGLRAGPTTLPERPTAAFPVGHHRIDLESDREQASIVLAWPGTAYGDPDSEALSLAAGVLGGQGGRLFLELRDRRGLAYGVGAETFDGLDPGAFFATMGTDPERVDQAVRGMHEIIRGLAEEGPTEEELQRCKQVTLGSLAMSRQRASSRAMELAYWQCYGRDALVERELSEAAWQAVTPEHLQRALADRLDTCVEVICS
jgi:zinc protease